MSGSARRFLTPLGEEVAYDGVSPIGLYLAANVLVVRDGKVLMVRQPPQWGGRWELPGGGIENGEALLDGAMRECYEETGYRFVGDSAEPFYVTEAWFGTSGKRYVHGVVFVYRGEVKGDVDPAWRQDQEEIVDVAWVDAKDLMEGTTRTIHWAALKKAGLV